MWEGTFLRDLALVLAASLPVLFLFRKLKAPAIAAFLVTGMLIGPHALGLVEDPRASAGSPSSAWRSSSSSSGWSSRSRG